jgi:4,4'-diaponeurosporenoate glycosyltransferase
MNPDLLVVVGWFAGFVLLWRLPLLTVHGGQPGRCAGLPAGRARPPSRRRRRASPPSPGGSTTSEASIPPTISVIVPARNEAANLPRLLASLASQQVPAHEIIAVDDHSEDTTAEVARRHPDVTVLEAPPLPDGWTGKNWACFTGARRAHGDLLVFLDADVVLAPAGLGALAATHRRCGGLVSVQPHHVVRRPYEWCSLVFSLMAIMGVGAASIRRPQRPRAAFGPCMVMAVDDYQRLGGHRRVASEVVEDLALGEVVADAGHPVTLLGGGGLLRYRMYPEGLRSLLQGWTKNIASGASRTPPVRTALAVIWVTAALSSVRYGRDAVAGDGSWLVAVGLMGAFAAQVGVLSRRVGTFPVISWLLYPVWFVLFVGVFAASLTSTFVTRQVTWRGRAIPLSTGRGATSVPPGPGPGT